MKRTIQLTAKLGCLLAFATIRTHAQLNVSSDGSDGALIITSNTVIDLSQAISGTWSNNNSANAGKGIYDSSKWAIVFKYSSVNIASNCTLSFLNHQAHAPVVWLVQSNVVIGTNSHLSLDGRSYVTAYPDYLSPTEPGPGGFRGGAYGPSGSGAGFGPGGLGTSGGYASYSGTYGNPQILPLIGGSGAGAMSSAGASAGGAILIAAGGTVTIVGQITSSGGVGYNGGGQSNHSYPSGGAVKVIANQVLGTGIISADRTRIEANFLAPQLNITPVTVAVPPGTNVLIWPATNNPVVTVLSVNGNSAPPDPYAGLSTSSDVSISTNGSVNIILQTQNFPPSGTVVVRVTPKYNNYYNVTATNVSGTFSLATWSATTTLPNGFCALQAHATSP